MKDAGSINCVAFEYAGHFAMASDTVLRTVTKEWTPLTTLNKQTKAVTSVAWGPDASYPAPLPWTRPWCFIVESANE